MPKRCAHGSVNMKDISILIVHYNTPGLLRQTLRGILRAAPQVRYEVIVVDNNPASRIPWVKEEFPEVNLIVSEKNRGFAGGMNLALTEATGRFVLVFNPDIIVKPGALETLVQYLDEHQDVGMVGPQLRHPDGSLQHSCYQFMQPSTILYRRIPFLRFLPSAKKQVEGYLMADWDHAEIKEVDYLLGAAMLVRREVMESLGGFDENFFMYFEDQDLCRRFWQAGWKVVYHPKAELIHYHRRETAEGGFLTQLFNPLTRIQMQSALYYYRKYRTKTE